MRIVAVIPARLASTRLPRKALREVAGKFLIGRVYEAVHGARLLDDVIIATDSDEVMQDPGVQVGTLMTPAASADIDNPSAVKVVTDSARRALYFSRATIPYD